MKQKIFRKNLSIIATLCIVFSLVQAGSQEAYAYTKFDVGARAIAMGGAHTAAVEGATALYFNPAALALIEGYEVNSMISTGMAFDRSHNFFGFGSELWTDAKRGIALGLISAKMSDLDGYDASNVPTGTFDVSDNTVMLSYAELMYKYNLYWGSTIKLYKSSIDSDDNTGFGFDFGALYIMNQCRNDFMDDLRFGLTVKDLFSSVDEDHIIPRMKLGLASHLQNDLFAAVDFGFNLEDDSDFIYALGLEYTIDLQTEIGPSMLDISNLQPRIGIRDGDFHFGFGMNFSILQVDYSFVPQPNSYYNDSHRFSLILKFN